MAIINIEEKAIQTYNENILFLQTKHPEVFNKIDALENALANGYYKDRYSLEYKDGYFDVLELESGKYLYSSDSYKYAKDVSNIIDFTKNTNAYSTFEKIDISDKQADEFEKENIEDGPLSAISKLINFYNHNCSEDKTSMKKLYKFIFLGVGLGTHIGEVHKKINSSLYYIIEDDLELFKLSLFVTNYSDIDKDGSDILFCIFGEDDEFRQTTQQFLNTSSIYNQYIKYFHMLSHSDKKLKIIHQTIASLSHITFNFSSLIISTLRPFDYLEKGYKFLNFNAIQKNLFQDKPALLLGGGPSFKNNILWIKQNQDKFIIVAISAILGELEKYNIKADIITHTHGFSDALVHIHKIQDISFFSDSIIIAGTMSYPKLIEFFPKENIFMHETNTTYKHNFNAFTNENIGADTYEFLLQFNIDEIYLLGLDFALDQKTGLSHADNHEYAYKVELEESQLQENINTHKDVVKIKGNFRDEVYSTLLLYNWSRILEEIYQFTTKKPKHIYNLSDGAFIAHTTPLPINKVKKLTQIDKKVLINDIAETLNQSSQKYLTKKEIDKLNLLINSANLKLNIIKEYQDTDEILDYHNKILQFMQDMLLRYSTTEHDELSEILSLYIKMVSGYIFDIINTKELKIDTKEIDRLFVLQIEKIIKHFRDRIQKYIDKSERYQWRP